ncbi:MAG: DUF2267 domain-containing protein [Bacteroidota bacterium]
MEPTVAYANYELNSLLKNLSQHTGYPEPSENYQYLKIIFDVIRQHSTFEESIKFNEMLPLPLKAIFLDGWHIPSGDVPRFENMNHLAQIVVERSNHSISSIAQARQLLRKVFAFLGQYATPTQRRDGFSFLPSEFRVLLLQDPGLKYAYSDTCIWLS